MTEPNEPAPAWVAACMEPDEWARWLALNPRSLGGIPVVERPCADCPFGFALEQRAIGRCNGEPGGAEEGDDVTAVPGGMATETVELEGAPCPGCAHREVCGIREKLTRAREVDVVMSPLPAGVSIKLTAAFECSHFLADRPRKHRNTVEWTPERRAAQSERIKAFNASKGDPVPA